MNPKALAKKKKSSRILRGGLLFLSSLSLISVGFASWNIGNGGRVETGLIITAEDTESIISFESKEGTASICKYGFVGLDGQLTDSFSFAYRFILNQTLARSINCIVGNETNLEISLINSSDESQFINLIRKGYLSGNVSTIYNGMNGTASKLAYFGNGISCTLRIANMTETEKETVTLNVVLNFDTSKSAEMQTYISSLPENSVFSYRLVLEMEKPS